MSEDPDLHEREFTAIITALSGRPRTNRVSEHISRAAENTNRSTDTQINRLEDQQTHRRTLTHNQS